MKKIKIFSFLLFLIIGSIVIFINNFNSDNELFYAFIGVNVAILVLQLMLGFKKSTLALKEAKKLNNEIFHLKMLLSVFFIMTLIIGFILVLLSYKLYLTIFMFIMFGLNFLYVVKLSLIVNYYKRRFEEINQIESTKQQKRNKLLNRLDKNPFTVDYNIVDNNTIIDTSINLKELIKQKKLTH
jgi:uncharacterized protein YacL